MTPREDGNSGDVLSSLPAKRPQRPSPRRAARGARGAPTERKAPQRSASPKASRAASKPSASARPATRRARSSARAKSPRKPAAVRPSVATSRAREPGPRAVPRSRRPEPPDRGGIPEGGLEIVTTAIQAAGELAQIGLAVGAGIVRGAIRRLPRP